MPEQKTLMTTSTPTSLSCGEELDSRCASPKLFPETLPGLWDLNRENICLLPNSQPQPRSIRADLDKEDVALVSELGKLSHEQLMEYVKNLQNNAFVLGVEEARQFARAKVLQIFRKGGRNNE